MISTKLDAISTTLINLHRASYEESPSPMKLQKLCYYAQGIHLAMNENQELFPEDFEAWTHGPVLSELYHKYKGNGWKGISDELNTVKLSEDERKFLTMIIDAYGRYDGAALSTMTHQESPWLTARGETPETEGSNANISKESLRHYFSHELAAQG